MLAHRRLRHPTPGQLGTADGQCTPKQRSAPALPWPECRSQHRGQQRQGEQRIENEQGGPFHRWCGQRRYLWEVSVREQCPLLLPPMG